MRIFLAGASGLIGSALADRLAAAGHQVVLGVRDAGAVQCRQGQAAVAMDYTRMGRTADWAGRLAGVDAVVNAVGIFREQGRQTFDALHVKGPGVLFEAALQAGVARIVQVSALGARPDAQAAFLASKGQADAALLQRAPGRATVVQPSLVFAPQGRSTRWFAMLASLPVAPLPGGGRQSLQPVHLDDLCDAAVRLLDSADPPQRLQAVGGTRLSLRDYLRTLRRALGFRGVFVPVPVPLASRLLRWPLFRAAPVTPDALGMLEAGSTGDSAAMASLLGRPPKGAEAFVSQRARPAMRRAAALGWLLPLLRWSLAALWISTGLVSAFVFPVASSLELLARTGLHGATAVTALYAAATLDVLLGVLLLPARTRRAACLAQLALVALYTVVITVCLPEFWRHPYGPVLKNLPLLAAITVLYYLDVPDGHPRR